MNFRIVLTGCSGGGKSTLLDALAARGHLTVPEPGRRIVQREMASGGGALPWTDGPAFARACIDMALADLAALPETDAPVFFDRSLLDAVIWLEENGHPAPTLPEPLPYTHAILLPPWPEIRTTDPERRHSMDEAVTEYHALAAGYPARGLPAPVMPRASIGARIDWLGSHLGLAL